MGVFIIYHGYLSSISTIIHRHTGTLTHAHAQIPPTPVAHKPPGHPILSVSLGEVPAQPSLPFSLSLYPSFSLDLCMCVLCTYQAKAHNAALTKPSGLEMCSDVAVPRPPCL